MITAGMLLVRGLRDANEAVRCAGEYRMGDPRGRLSDLAAPAGGKQHQGEYKKFFHALSMGLTQC